MPVSDKVLMEGIEDQVQKYLPPITQTVFNEVYTEDTCWVPSKREIDTRGQFCKWSEFESEDALIADYDSG